MTNIKIKKTEGAEESVELMAQSVVQVAKASEKLLNSGLTKRAIVILLQAGIGASRISQTQIYLVLDNLPRLKAWYVKEK